MNELPEKVFSQYPPTIIDTPNGRYVVFEVGSNWYPVDANFTHEDAMTHWERKRGIIVPPQEEAKRAAHAIPVGKKIVVKTTSVASSTNAAKSYEVLEYDDGSYSCNCPSWVFKNKGTDSSEERMCKHIVKVKQEQA